MWWAIVLGVAWALGLGLLFGAWMHRDRMPRMPGLSRATTYFAGAIGGASEMTLLAERVHARTDLVASAHSLRMVVVTVLIPFAFSFSGLHGIDLSPPGPREADWRGWPCLPPLPSRAALR